MPLLLHCSSGSRTYQLEAPDKNAMMFWLQELQTKRREFSKTLDVSSNIAVNNFFTIFIVFRKYFI